MKSMKSRQILNRTPSTGHIKSLYLIEVATTNLHYDELEVEEQETGEDYGT